MSLTRFDLLSETFVQSCGVFCFSANPESVQQHPKIMARILIVEDKKITYLNFARELKACGYEVADFTPSGELALERLEKEPLPDLVILDIELAGEINGITVGRFIAQHHPIPFIYLSSLVKRKTQALSTSPFAFLDKPVSSMELEEKVRELLQAVAQLKTKLKGEEKDKDPVLFMQKATELVRLRLQDLRYVESLGNHQIRIFMGERVHACSMDIKAFLERVEEAFPEHEFQRVHRQFLANLAYFERLKGKSRSYQLYLQEVEQAIPVGKTYEDELLAKLSG